MRKELYSEISPEVLRASSKSYQSCQNCPIVPPEYGSSHNCARPKANYDCYGRYDDENYTTAYYCWTFVGIIRWRRALACWGTHVVQIKGSLASDTLERMWILESQRYGIAPEKLMLVLCAETELNHGDEDKAYERRPETKDSSLPVKSGCP